VATAGDVKLAGAVSAMSHQLKQPRVHFYLKDGSASRILRWLNKSGVLADSADYVNQRRALAFASRNAAYTTMAMQPI